MRNKKFWALMLIVVLNVAISTMVTIYLNKGIVSSDPLNLAQVPGGVASATDQYTINDSDYTDVPGMSLLTSFTGGGNLVVTFSAEAFPTITSLATSVITRCLVDGIQVEPGEVTFQNYVVNLANPAETRNTTVVFVARNLSPGVHQVRIQGRRAGPTGGVTLRERTMAVINVQ
jgi:hypothetical protein